MNIQNLTTDNLLNIIQIIIKDYEYKLDNQNKYYDEKISIYQDIIENKDNQINYLERQFVEITDEYHNEIIKNISLQNQLSNNHLT